MTHRSFFTLAAVLLCTAGFFSACDVGVNPLLFDGTPVVAEVVIHPDPGATVFGYSDTINLGDILDDIEDDFDSVNVFNITLKMENTGGMDSTTLLSGGGLYNGDTLLSFQGKPLYEFLQERSVFRMRGLKVHRAGIRSLKVGINSALRGGGPTTAIVQVGGTSSNANVNLKAIFKIYTQVFTKKG
jgi:hypothetical protein